MGGGGRRRGSLCGTSVDPTGLDQMDQNATQSKSELRSTAWPDGGGSAGLITYTHQGVGPGCTESAPEMLRPNQDFRSNMKHTLFIFLE